MSSDRFYEFFIEDDRARWRCALWSIILGGATSALAVILGARSDLDIALVSGTIASASLGVQLYLYMTAPSPRPVALRVSVPAWRTNWKLALVTVAISILAVIESWLTRLAGDYTLADNIIPRIPAVPAIPVQPRRPELEPNRNFDNASSHRRDEALKIYSDASMALSEIAQNHQIENVAQFRVDAARAALLYASASSDKRLVTMAYVTANAVPIAVAVQEMHRRGGGSWIIDGGMFGGRVGAHIESNAFLYRVKFGNNVAIDIPIRGSVVRIQTGPFVVAAECTLENCDQVLDGIIWINTTFSSCTLSYRGGVLSLAQIRFVNCIFDDTFSGVKEKPQIQRMMASTGEPFSYSSNLG